MSDKKPKKKTSSLSYVVDAQIILCERAICIINQRSDGHVHCQIHELTGAATYVGAETMESAARICLRVAREYKADRSRLSSAREAIRRLLDIL